MRPRSFRTLSRPAAVVAAVAVAALGALALGGCGSSTSLGDAANNFSPLPDPNIHLLINAWPEYFDPQADSSTQGAMLYWQTYLGLTTFNHAGGAAGEQAVPGVATALPTVSDGGRVYTATLRRGLVYSNGDPVHASDFNHTVQRAISLHWSGAGAFVEPLIEGAAAYAAGDAKTISGIVADNRTRTITIHLTRAFPQFDRVLAQSGLALIDPNTPMVPQSRYAPAGIGPYIITRISPAGTMRLAQNILWAQEKIPTVPAGYSSINVRLDADIGGSALSLLNNSEDLLDPGNVIPGGVLGQVHRLAPKRLRVVSPGTSTDYIFMNVRAYPFDNARVRRAVSVGLDRTAMISGLVSGWMQPGCTLLPPAIAGHVPGAGCSATGDLARARALVAASGDARAKVTVWSPPTAPAIEWMTKYTAMLNAIGLRAQLRVVNTALFSYSSRVGTVKVGPQTGYGTWSQSLASPLSFYGSLLYGGAIAPTGNLNLSMVSDPVINRAVDALGSTAGAGSDTGAVAARWRALDRYVERRDYLAVIGYRSTPFFISDRIVDAGVAMTSPIYGWDLSRVELTPTYQ